ncbi:receptor-transporting protein 4 [Fukomys damarensis]|uniref:Receptor-transporting protein 4 n=1 Tax=Fukomys damarensis TaxID=885580 RepID=A0A091DM25_FUKDA|nr:receptor-transporting protein 4 [Fukomys damarensis]KFO33169.1 Receptor-transporting protein 4 [Fukomys damarensis]
MVLDIRTWEQTFQELIQQEKPWAKWTLRLKEEIEADSVAPEWKQHQQTAVGRFWCTSCHQSWDSAQVKILCHVYWEHWTCQGQVLMRIFAQRCPKCFYSQLENPEFSTDSIMKILENLAQYILHRYYGHGFRKRPVIWAVPLQGPHDSRECQSCLGGVCVQGSQRRIIEKPSTSSPQSLEIQGSSHPDSGVLGNNEPRFSWNILISVCFILACLTAILNEFKK